MTTTTRLSDQGRNGQTAPHNPTTDDPFALIPGAYDDYTPPATKPAAQAPATDRTHVHSPAGWNANTASDDENTGVCEGPSGCGRAITRTSYDRWDANTASSTPPPAAAVPAYFVPEDGAL